MSAVGSLVLILDEALDDVFETRSFRGNQVSDDLRSVIYMLRCAFTHGPCDPKWRIDKEKYKRCFFLPKKFWNHNGEQENMIFDFANLDGQGVESEHFYGLNGLISLALQTQELIRDSK